MIKMRRVFSFIIAMGIVASFFVGVGVSAEDTEGDCSVVFKPVNEVALVKPGGTIQFDLFIEGIDDGEDVVGASIATQFPGGKLTYVEFDFVNEFPAAKMDADIDNAGSILTILFSAIINGEDYMPLVPDASGGIKIGTATFTLIGNGGEVTFADVSESTTGGYAHHTQIANGADNVFFASTHDDTAYAIEVGTPVNGSSGNATDNIAAYFGELKEEPGAGAADDTYSISIINNGSDGATIKVIVARYAEDGRLLAVGMDSAVAAKDVPNLYTLAVPKAALGSESHVYYWSDMRPIAPVDWGMTVQP